MIGFHASHEQFSPRELLDHVRAAERAGFDMAMCSDHLFPWSEAQGHSGYAWSWLGSALEASSLPLGVICAPGYRYHPAIIAQAAATLEVMYPRRFWLGLGSGERINEHITGEAWPVKSERNERLKECVAVMRALWAGETVNHFGRIRVEHTKLYSLPDKPPPIVGAALSPKTAEFLGAFVDGIVTINQPREKLQAMIDAFRRGGGEGKPLYLQVKVSYAKTDEEALRGAHEQWRCCVSTSEVLSELRTVEEMEAVGKRVRPEDMHEHVHISSDLGRHAAWLAEYASLGFSKIFIHNVNREQSRFIDDFGARVLPEVKRGNVAQR